MIKINVYRDAGEWFGARWENPNMTHLPCGAGGQHQAQSLQAACPACNPGKTVPELNAAYVEARAKEIAAMPQRELTLSRDEAALIVEMETGLWAAGDGPVFEQMCALLRRIEGTWPGMVPDFVLQS